MSINIHISAGKDGPELHVGLRQTRTVDTEYITEFSPLSWQERLRRYAEVDAKGICDNYTIEDHEEHIAEVKQKIDSFVKVLKEGIEPIFYCC